MAAKIKADRLTFTRPAINFDPVAFQSERITTGGGIVISEEQRQDPVAKGETERRYFLKKIAIATAFAAPTIATFSVDSLRKKAFAQGQRSALALAVGRERKAT